MRIVVAAGLTGVALISLAACGKPAPGAGGASAPAASAAPPGPITAAQIPHRRPGLWRQVIAMDTPGAAGPGTQLCVDEASEARMSAFAQRVPSGHCVPPQFIRNLDGSIGFSESCDMGASGKASTTGVIRGDFNSGYTSTMDTQYSGSPVAQLNGDHKMTITATWMGPCAPGQRGGDLIMPGGMTRNILDDEAKRGGVGN